MTNAFASAAYPVPEDVIDAVTSGYPLESRTLPDLLREHLDGKPGYVALTGLHHLTLDEAKAFTLASSRNLGRLLPQDSSGTLLRAVTDRGKRLGEGSTGRYSDSRQGGNLHTDGPHVPPPTPDYFALYCVHQAKVGGALCLVHVNEVMERLPDWALAALRTNFHFDRREADVDEPTVVRPVLTDTEDGVRVCYLREYIEIAHRRPEVPDLTEEQRRAMDLLDSVLDDPTAQMRGRLEPGQMAFFNNRVLLHGRTAFEDSPGDDKRLMLRTWVQTARHA